MPHPTGFIPPCQPTKAAKPPTGPLWVHEIKHDGYRLMVRRDGSRVRCFTRNGHDWADRFPAIVDAASSLKATSFLIARRGHHPRRRATSSSEFNALRSRSRGGEVMTYRLRPDRARRRRPARATADLTAKRRRARLIGKTKRMVDWINPVRRSPHGATARLSSITSARLGHRKASCRSTWIISITADPRRCG